MPPLRIIIVDDERRVRKSLVNVLKLHFPKGEVVAEAENVDKAVEAINLHKPDIVLLDIKMPGASGFDVLNRLKPYTFKVIFITAFDQYAVQAFKFSAVDYLLKPVVPQELVEALQRASEQLTNETSNMKLDALLTNLSSLNRERKRLVLNSNDKTDIIAIDDIIRCEADGNYTHFFLNNRKSILVSRPIREYEDILTPFDFFRSHNSHLVNLMYVDRLEKKECKLIMKDGTESFVSSRRLPDLVAALNKL